MRAMGIPIMIILLLIVAVVLLVLVYALVRSTWMLVTVATADSARSFLCGLLGVGAVFP